LKGRVENSKIVSRLYTQGREEMRRIFICNRLKYF